MCLCFVLVITCSVAGTQVTTSIIGNKFHGVQEMAVWIIAPDISWNVIRDIKKKQ